MLSRIQKLNPHVTIIPVTDDAFRQFGSVIKNIDFSEIIRLIGDTAIPEDSNRYVADDNDLCIKPFYNEVKRKIFGEMDIEIGYCNGHTHCLNAMEYHKSSEVNFTVSDCVLMLASFFNIREGKLSADDVIIFYLPAGTAVELYATTLHFAPCAIDKKGFQVGIILPKHTNKPLSTGLQSDEPMLFANNKWLLAHPDAPSAKRGAYCGITGENITLNI